MAQTGVFLDWGCADGYDVWSVREEGGKVIIHREGVDGPHGSIKIDQTMTEEEFLERFGKRHEGAEYRKFREATSND